MKFLVANYKFCLKYWPELPAWNSVLKFRPDFLAWNSGLEFQAEIFGLFFPGQNSRPKFRPGDINSGLARNFGLQMYCPQVMNESILTYLAWLNCYSWKILILAK